MPAGNGKGKGKGKGGTIKVTRRGSGWKRLGARQSSREFTIEHLPTGSSHGRMNASLTE